MSHSHKFTNQPEDKNIAPQTEAVETAKVEEKKEPAVAAPVVPPVVTEEPKTEAPKVEAPKAEETKVEEPKKEEPKKEEVKVTAPVVPVAPAAPKVASPAPAPNAPAAKENVVKVDPKLCGKKCKIAAHAVKTFGYHTLTSEEKAMTYRLAKVHGDRVVIVNDAKKLTYGLRHDEIVML